MDKMGLGLLCTLCTHTAGILVLEYSRGHAGCCPSAVFRNFHADFRACGFGIASRVPWIEVKIRVLNCRVHVQSSVKMGNPPMLSLLRGPPGSRTALCFCCCSSCLCLTVLCTSGILEGEEDLQVIRFRVQEPRAKPKP